MESIEKTRLNVIFSSRAASTIKRIKERYDFVSDADAVRFAVNQMGQRMEDEAVEADGTPGR